MRDVEWVQPGLVIGVVAKTTKTLMEIREKLLRQNGSRVVVWKGFDIWLKDGTRLWLMIDTDVERLRSVKFDQLWIAGAMPGRFWKNVRMTDRVPEEWRVLYI